MDGFSVECPKCGAKRGRACRTLTTGRVTDTHKARGGAFWSAVRRITSAR